MATQDKLGKTKNSTDSLIDDALAQQQDWLERRRSFTRFFWKSLNTFAKPSPNKKTVGKPAVKSSNGQNTNKSILREYWFPILCAFIVICITIWVAFNHINKHNTIITTPVPEPIVRTVRAVKTPDFDIVRIDNNGSVIIAGRWHANSNISVFINNKLTATIMTDKNGEFVYAPTHNFKPGNYTISLIDTESNIKSENKVFIYIPETGDDSSFSLLMTENGSTVLQKPFEIQESDLKITKIDYMSGGRLVVTGDGLPRMRISVTLNDEVLGTVRVSDYKHFGLGADVDELIPGSEYTINVRMHDGDGNIIAETPYKFVMPQMTGDDDTYYTVRRGDCLWVIARNFMRRGILFSVIAERNHIKNPDLIYPTQKLNIPVTKTKRR